MTVLSYLLDLAGFRFIKSSGTPIPDSKTVNYTDNMQAAYNPTTGEIDVGAVVAGTTYVDDADAVIQAQIDASLIPLYANNAALRAVQATAGDIARTADQDTTGDGCGGLWRYETGVALDYVQDGLTCLVKTGEDGSEGWVKESGSVIVLSIGDDTAVPMRAPRGGGFLSMLGSPGDFPQGTRSCNALYDCGSTPAMTDIWSGANVEYGTGVPTGTTGTDERVTLFASDGFFHLENREGASNNFRLNLFL